MTTLPQLPASVFGLSGPVSLNAPYAPAYSTDQMIAYGQECYAAGRVSVFEEPPICEIVQADNIDGFMFKEIDGRMKFLRIGVDILHMTKVSGFLLPDGNALPRECFVLH